MTEALNGTEISCQDFDSPNSTSVTISVINSSVQSKFSVCVICIVCVCLRGKKRVGNGVSTDPQSGG